MQYEDVMKIQLYSHFFKVLNPTPTLIGLLLKFSTRYVIYAYVKENGRTVHKPFKVFAARARNNSEFRFHIGQFEDFISFMQQNHITDNLYTVIKVELYKPKTIPVKLLPQWVLRDYQQQAHDFIVSESIDDNHSRMLSIHTGGGKTVCALAATSSIKTRTMIVVLATYIEKWSQDVTTYLDVKPKQILRIQGSNQLKGMIDAAMDNTLEASFVIVSLTTLQNYYKTYEADPDSIADAGYGCVPERLCEVLSIGSILIDETHLFLHAVFKLLIYSHVPKVIALSATLVSDDPMITKIQRLMFPREIRFDSVKMEQYIKVYALSYRFKDIQRARIRTSEFGSNVYSHTAFEKSLLRNPMTTSGYLEMINYTMNIGYVDQYIEGDRLIIFAATVAMCDVIVRYLTAKYPQYDIRRYVAEDPYENAIEPDIRVTTIISAGTALDIPNLRCTIMTNSIKSIVANLQVLGRLRKLKDRDAKFYYVYCEQIPKHKEYSNYRKEIFAEKALSIKDFTYPNMV